MAGLPTAEQAFGAVPPAPLKGMEGNLDPKTAGDNWSSFGVAVDGLNLTLALPTQPGDKPPSGDGLFLGSAVERWSKDHKSFGTFDGEDNAAAFMKANNGLPTADQAFGTEAPGWVAKTDKAIQDSTYGILNKFSYAVSEIPAAVAKTKQDVFGDAPLPTPDTAFSLETEKTLKRFGVLGNANGLQTMFDAVIRAVAAGLELLGRAAVGTAGQALKKIGGSEASDTMEAQTFGMGFLGGPEGNLEHVVAKARARGLLGEGEGGTYDAVPLTPENTAARAEAAKEAGMHPPEPLPPPKGVHELAQRIEPEAIQKFNALEIEKDQLKGQIPYMTDGPELDKAHAALQAAQAAQDDLVPALRWAYRQAHDMMVPPEVTETGPRSALTIQDEHDAEVSRLESEGIAMVGKGAPKAAVEPVPEAPVAKPALEGTGPGKGPGLKAVEGTGELKTRALAEGVEAKAIEGSLTQGFGDLPEYHQVSMEDQATKAVEYMGKDYDAAKAVAMGRKAAPKGVFPESVFVAVEKRALAEGDVETLRDLATNSKLSTEATTMGQRIRTLRERDPASPVGAIQEVQQAREAALADVDAAKQAAVKEIRTEMKRAASKRPVWEDFINTITCGE